uniref:Putative secreted protein n=1 Tax=Ixodes ricinus TaxID=34613 RepID=A0A6B0UC37_IXORI
MFRHWLSITVFALLNCIVSSSFLVRSRARSACNCEICNCNAKSLPATALAGELPTTAEDAAAEGVAFGGFLFEISKDSPARTVTTLTGEADFLATFSTTSGASTSES